MRLKKGWSEYACHKFAGGLLCLFLLVSCGGVDEAQLVSSARSYVEQHKLREASLELKNVLQQNPKNAEARFLLGELNLVFGDMSTAARNFRLAREAGWDEAAALLGMARAMLAAQKYNDVLALEIKDVFPKSIQANLYGLKAYAFAAIGKNQRAVEMLDKGRAIDGNAVELLRTSVQIAISNQDYSQAKNLLKRGLSYYPDNTGLLLLSGYLAMAQGSNIRAVRQFDRVVANEPRGLVTFSGRQAMLALARLSLLKKDLVAAQKQVEPVLKQAPDDLEANYIQALVYFEQGNYEQAELRLLKVFKYMPSHAKSLLLYGAVSFAQNNHEQAAYYLSKYLQQVPSDTNVRKLLGRSYLLLERQEEAEAVLLPGMRLSENDAELMALIGVSQLKSGDLATGISGLEKALEIEPQSHALRSELARAYIFAGQTEQAISQLDKMQQDGGSKSQTEVLRIAAYLRAGQYNDAIRIVHDLLKRQPDDAVTYALAGNVFAASGDKKEARRYFNQSIALKPDYSLAKILLGALEEEEGSLEAAELLYRQVVAEKKSSVEPYLALARIARTRGDEGAMLSWLERAREQVLNDQRSRLVLAEYYLSRREQGKAGAVVKELLDLAPDDPKVMEIQGRLLISQQRFNEAVKPLNRLVNRRAVSVRWHVLLGEVYLQLGQIGGARGQLESALAVDAYNVPALLLLTNLELTQGSPERAKEYIQRVHKLKPDSAIAYTLEGAVYEKQKNYSAAVRAYSKALKLQPLSEVVIKLARTYMLMDEADKAKRVLRDWLRSNPESVDVHKFLGSIYQTGGENRAAVIEYKRVLEIAPDDVLVLNNLAWIYNLENNPEAMVLAEKAYSLAPESPGVLDTYGWILVEQGQANKGRHLLKKALVALPESPDVQYHYAVALARTGERAEARERLRRLLDSNELFSGRQNVKKLLESW